jgi:hypothetical protein
MAVKLSPFGPKPHFEDSNGDPLSGGLLYFYGAGGSTPQDTYTTSAGSVANANPVVLDSRGEPSSQIWFTEGLSYKATLKTSAGVEIWSSDNLSGLNDTSVTIDQWIAGTTPTYISATSFSVTTDQSSTYHVGRRIKSTNTSGTIYSTVTAVAYSSVTTVTVANDSGSLDSGLSAVWYGINSANFPSVSPESIFRKATAVAAAATTNIWATAGDYLHITGTATTSSFGTAGYAGGKRQLVVDGRLVLIHGTSLSIPGTATTTFITNDRLEVRADTTTNHIITKVQKASGNTPFIDSDPVVVGATDGTKKLRFEVDGFTTATERVATPPDRDFTIGDASVSGTEQATTSGTEFDFSIPSWAKKITMTLAGVSLSGTDNLLVQIGDAGGVEATGYIGATSTLPNAGAISTSTLSTGFAILVAGAGATVNGSILITLHDSTDFTWAAQGVFGNPGDTSTKLVGGYKSLSAALTTVRLTRSGTDTFDAGAVNVVYE